MQTSLIGKSYLPNAGKGEILLSHRAFPKQQSKWWTLSKRGSFAKWSSHHALLTFKSSTWRPWTFCTRTLEDCKKKSVASFELVSNSSYCILLKLGSEGFFFWAKCFFLMSWYELQNQNKIYVNLSSWDIYACIWSVESGRHKSRNWFLFAGPGTQTDSLPGLFVDSPSPPYLCWDYSPGRGGGGGAQGGTPYRR